MNVSRPRQDDAVALKIDHQALPGQPRDAQNAVGPGHDRRPDTRQLRMLEHEFADLHAIDGYGRQLRSPGDAIYENRNVLRGRQPESCGEIVE
jgi:hypothetical protein